MSDQEKKFFSADVPLQDNLVIADYILDKELNDNEAFFKFCPNKKSEKTVWHVHLMTCEYYYQSHRNINERKQMIDLKHDKKKDCISVCVCLNISKITRPVIQKTIIMLTQYKKLKPGKHLFG